MATVSESTFGGANGLLEVYVSRARDLPNLRKLDKQSPFVRLRISHMTETSEVAFRGGQTPRFDFYSKFDLTPDVKPAMIVEIFDDKSPPKLIGQATIDLTPALYKDPEDGHDDWFPLKVGNEFAGQVYMELTFHPLVPTSRLQRNKSNEISAFEASLESRPPPPLPSKVPSLSLAGPPEGLPSIKQNHSTYSHASRVRSNYAPSEFDNSNTRQASPLRSTPEFTLSVTSNGTYSSQLTNESHESHATLNTVNTTEPLFAKLKQLKERWKLIKNPTNDQLERENKVDLKALQKVVGVEPDEVEHESTATREPSLASAFSKLSTQPPLPPLPSSPSRRISYEPNSYSESRRSLSKVDNSPRLPPLPSSPSSNLSPKPRTYSASPNRRKPPPLG